MIFDNKIEKEIWAITPLLHLKSKHKGVDKVKFQELHNC